MTIVLLGVAFALILVGCGGRGASMATSTGAPPPPDAGTDGGADGGCAAGEMPLDGGGCQPAGLPPDMPCSPGETPLDGGACQPAGVPPGACGKGFQSDKNGGCDAILPAASCAHGQLAVPGDTNCHEIAPCGNGDYGDIPVEVNTQFVNGAYAGGGSDGSPSKPWTTIQEGVDHAEANAIVALAAGIYEEDVTIFQRPVRLWGRCPGMVQIVGMNSPFYAVEVYGAADKAELHALAISATGTENGINLSGVNGIIIDRVWIHDTGGWGLQANSQTGHASVEVAGSLIEEAVGAGVAIFGADAIIDSTVVRNTQIEASQNNGVGINVGRAYGYVGSLTLQGSLVESNYGIGVAVFGSGVVAERTIVRNTKVVPGAMFTGRAVNVQQVGGRRASMSIKTSVIEQNQEAGVVVSGSDLAIETTVIRTNLGIGIELKYDGGQRATGGVLASLVDGNGGNGVHVLGADATFGATVVRNTLPNAVGLHGTGIEADLDNVSGQRASAVIRTSLVDSNYRQGVAIAGSDGTITSTVVRETLPDSGGNYGYGVAAQEYLGAPATITIQTSLIEHNVGVGVVVFGADAIVDTTVVRATQPFPTKTGEPSSAGIGLDVATGPLGGSGSATVRGSLFEQNNESGVDVFGSNATIEWSVVRKTQANIQGKFGDGIFITNSSRQAASARIVGTLVGSSARAGISNFGASVTLGGSVVSCNAFDLDGEALGETPSTFTNLGDNLCGCPNPTTECKAESASLMPPPQLPPPPSP